MKINLERLNSLIEANGFVALRSRNPQREIRFTRASIADGLFEQLWIDCDGRAGDAVSAYAVVSTVRGLSLTKGMVELRLLHEVAQNSDRGWTMIAGDAQAADWELRLSRLAPAIVRDFAERAGSALLARTMSARTAAAQYAKKLVQLGGTGPACSTLLEQSTPEQGEVAERLVRQPGVLQIPDRFPLYRLATLTMALFGDEIEGRTKAFHTVNPLTDREVMWRIQFIVDWLDSIGGRPAPGSAHAP